MRSINAALDALKPRIFNNPIPRSTAFLPLHPQLNACVSKTSQDVQGARRCGCRPDRQARRRSRAGEPESACRTCARQQRYQVDGLLQGMAAPLLSTQAVRTDEHHQEFNARTGHINPGTPLPCRVTVRPDRTFHFEVRTPQTSWLLLNAADAPMGKKGRRKGAAKPGHEVAGTVSLKHVYEIAKVKQSELRLSGLSLEGLCKSIIYQARSIGINVVA